MTRRACPTLVTARLTLAPHRVEDYADMVETWRDPVVVRFFGGVASSPEEVWARLLRYGGMWPLVGHGFWAARETATGRFVGEVGLAEFRRDVEPSLIGTPEAGWVLASWAHGLGLAREATEAMLAWADAELGVPRIACMIDPHNEASLALAAKLGFRPFADTQYKAKPTVLLERFAPP